jgi:Zn-dependent protease with chaperone function
LRAIPATITPIGEEGNGYGEGAADADLTRKSARVRVRRDFMDLEMAVRYEHISSRSYEHPADRAATSALHSVPMLDAVVKKLSDLGHERRLGQVVMGNAIRINADQLPEVWSRYQHCVSVLDLDRTPPLFVCNEPVANAMTIGSHKPMVVVNSSLIASYTPDEVQTVLAHEVGHVLSEHYHYTTALLLLKQVLDGALPRSLLLGLPVRAMYLALLEWSRAAELSADRAAAIVRADPLAPCRVLMRLAGGALPGMSFDAFLKQATEYHEEDDLFSRHTRFWTELNMTHPFAVRRVKELVLWVQAGDYDRIRAGQYPRRGEEPPPSAEFNAAVAHYGERFAAFLERTAGDVQRVGRQLTDWLKQHTTGNSETEEPADTGARTRPVTDA